MAITVTSLTVLGTAVPWKFGGTTVNAGTANTLASFNSKYCDGSAAQLAPTSTVNLNFVFGQQHVTPSGETGPTLLSVTPGQFVILQYNSGTVQTQSASAGNSPPTGSPTSTLVPLPGGGTDAQGYVMPTNVIKGYRGINVNGTCNTSGTTVTLTAGNTSNAMIGLPVWINNALFTVASIQSSTQLTLTATAGTQTGVSFFFYSATTGIGGLVGGFVDSGNNLLSTFDWQSYGGTSSANSFITLIAPANAAQLSLGINDSILRDNTGSFSMTAIQLDTASGPPMVIGGVAPFKHFPNGLPNPCTAFIADSYAPFSGLVWLETYPTWQNPAVASLLAPLAFGQIFPRGGQNSGGNPPGVGQIFPA